MSSYIGDIAAMTSTQSTSSVKKSTDTFGLDMTDFLKMMVAQFQNQDPENAADTSEMLNQMVQMSMIQAIADITDAVSLSYSASLVGKEVTVGTFDSEGKLQEVVGTVTGTGSYNGSPVIYVDGQMYSMSSIMAVGRLPSTEPAQPEQPEQPDVTEPGGTGETGA
ncbi:flagellar hook assembly protein FlgD [uncultured Oscillibacter sp.]|uniref:flagellar hook assembly protein FlgD n=1 Tax=uncultured Oscillibacter sp. TaxID=876091 RepID=UPI0025E00BAE|nr:flagellar hook capping FlgD N-terminal domain-containing protein [uncultured Oscillibacter sp.]